MEGSQHNQNPNQEEEERGPEQERGKLGERKDVGIGEEMCGIYRRIQTFL